MCEIIADCYLRFLNQIGYVLPRKKKTKTKIKNSLKKRREKSKRLVNH